MSGKTPLLLSNVIDADHQNSWFEMEFELNCMSNTLPISLARLLEQISAMISVCNILVHMTMLMRVGSL